MVGRTDTGDEQYLILYNSRQYGALFSFSMLKMLVIVPRLVFELTSLKEAHADQLM